jgi:hypothetical protein
VITTAGYSDPQRLVDRRGVGRNKGVELTECIFDLSPVEVGKKDALVLVNGGDCAEIAIEHLLVVVVLGLHDLIVWQEDGAEVPLNPRRGVWVECRLEDLR